MANGAIVNVHVKENPELLWALRGGSHNFGIVTRIYMQTFEQVLFFGGFSYHLPDVWVDEVVEFVRINDLETYDEFAHLVWTWGFSASSGLLTSARTAIAFPPSCSMDLTTFAARLAEPSDT